MKITFLEPTEKNELRRISKSNQYKEFGFKHDTGRHIGRDTGGHRLAAVCFNDDDTVGTFSTVEGCSVAEHGHLFNVGRIQCRQNIVEESLVQHSTAILLVDDDIVDDDQRLCVHVE